jgi:hypothetical protein
MPTRRGTSRTAVLLVPWVDMRLHESHDEGGFGVSNNTIARRAALYTTNARSVAFLATFACPAQQVWLPGNDLQDPATWDAPPLCQLRRLHEDLLQHYDCTDQPAAAQPAPPSAQAAALLPTRAQTCSLSTQAPRTTATANSFFHSSTASTRHSSGVRFPPRHLPALRTSSPLGPAPFRRNSVSRSSSPSKQWPQFKALRQHDADTRFGEQRQLHRPQKYKATVPESWIHFQQTPDVGAAFHIYNPSVNASRKVVGKTTGPHERERIMREARHRVLGAYMGRILELVLVLTCLLCDKCS